MRLILALLLMLGTVSIADAGRRGGGGRGGGGQQHHYYQHRDRGGDFIGGVIGGVIGGIIAGSNPVPQPYYDPYDPVGECIRRFRSYRPETGIYYGYDGRPRRCP